MSAVVDELDWPITIPMCRGCIFPEVGPDEATCPDCELPIERVRLMPAPPDPEIGVPFEYRGEWWVRMPAIKPGVAMLLGPHDTREDAVVAYERERMARFG